MLVRERFAWGWLSALVVVFGTYFAVVAAQRSHADLPFITRIGMLAAATTVLAVVAGAIRLFGRGRLAHELDERDRLIELRSSSVAYYVLMGGMIVVGCVMPFSAGGWDLVHAALLAIVIAEIVHHGLVVLGYRRGWRV